MLAAGVGRDRQSCGPVVWHVSHDARWVRSAAVPALAGRKWHQEDHHEQGGNQERADERQQEAGQLSRGPILVQSCGVIHAADIVKAAPEPSNPSGRDYCFYASAASRPKPLRHSIRLTIVNSHAFVAVALVAGLTWAGCGGDPTKSGTGSIATPSLSPAAVAQAWATARNDGDAAKTCSLYTAQIREQLAASYGTCEAFYRQRGSTNRSGVLPFGDRGLVAVRIRQSGDHASGELLAEKGPQTSYKIELIRQDGNWYVSNSGP
jgi:hypothetical protein